MSITGRFSEFNEEVEDFVNYLERFDLYLKANSVEDSEKVPLFLTVIGPKNYAVIKNLCLPDAPASKEYNELVKVFKNHFAPEKSIIWERCKFHKRFQKDGETLAQYAVEIKHLAASCNFGSFLNDAMRDRFVSGIASEEIQQRLMTEPDDNNKTFAKFLEIACRLEAAKLEVKDFHSPGDVGSSTAFAVGPNRHRPKQQFVSKYSKVGLGSNRPGSSQPSNDVGASKKGLKCYCCGRAGHTSNKCSFRNASCYSCGKSGHLSSVCRGKQHSGSNDRYKPSKSKVNYVHEEDDVEACYDLGSISLVGLNEISLDKCFKTTLMVENVELEMLIDTGASSTVLPKHVYDNKFSHVKLSPCNLQLKSYTGHQLELLGEFHAKVEHGGQTHQLPMVVVGIEDPRQPVLLGRNWLTQLKLDWNQVFQVGSRIEKGKCHQLKPCKIENYSSVEISLKNKYKDVFEGPVGLIKGISTDIMVDEEATPVFCKARPVPYPLKEAVETEIERLVESGIIYPVKDSVWATPLVCITKPDGKSVRLCSDFKVTLNKVLKNAEHYPLPTQDDLFAKLSGGKIFSKVDLSNAYLQLSVGVKSQPYLTVNTHLGLFRYRRLPFGIKSAPSQFQAAMDKILAGLESTYCFLDDIIVIGYSVDDSLKKTEALLQRLREYGIRANCTKSNLLQSSIDFLGHRIDQQGIHPTDKLVQAILRAPQPTNVTQLKSFLGLLNFYGKFLPNLSTVLHPMHQLLHKTRGWAWDSKCTEAFETCKQMLVQSDVLVPYDPNLKIEVTADASPYGVGCVLSHILPDGTVRPVAFASRTLTKAEMGYAQLDREALAIIYAVKKFHKYIYGRNFTLVTDHAPLTVLFGEKKGIPVLAAARMQRWAIILSAYDYNIIHRKGTDLVEADALSRLPSKVESKPDEDSINFFAPFPEMPLTALEISQATRRDPVYSKVLDFTFEGWPEFIQTSDPIHPFFVRKNELSIEHGCVLWGNRVLIPACHQKYLLNMLHEEHPGICKMKALARNFVWWPKMDEDIESIVKSCSICQMTRKSVPKAPLQQWTWPTRRWHRVHMDFGTKDGVTFLIIIDSFSKWVEVFQMNGTSATSTLDKLRTCISAYGIMDNLVSDNGPPFQSAEFKEFVKANGINHIFSPPYHPSSNGQVENMVGTFKTSLLKQVLHDNYKGPKRSLQHKLSCFLFSYRNTPHSTTGKTPAELFLGFHPRTRFSLLKPHLLTQMEHKQNKIKKWSDRTRGEQRLFNIGQEVLVKSVRGEEIKWMPGIVIKVVSPVTYIVHVLGQKRFVHVDHLRESEIVFPSKERIIRDRMHMQTPMKPSPPTSPPALLNSPKVFKSPSPQKLQINSPPKSLVNPSDHSNTDQGHDNLRRSKRNIKAPTRLDL